jgi:hypothetical protein
MIDQPPQHPQVYETLLNTDGAYMCDIAVPLVCFIK